MSLHNANHDFAWSWINVVEVGIAQGCLEEFLVVVHSSLVFHKVLMLLVGTQRDWEVTMSDGIVEAGILTNDFQFFCWSGCWL